ncbi:MAG: ABC transporter permease, partial [Bacteroidota bacterium]
MVKKPKLLKVTDRLLTSICKSHLLESILGDLEETYAANLTSVGAFRAGFSYFIQSIGFLKPVFLKKSSHSNTKAMFRNYFIATVRNLQRHKFYALINLIGLSIGMTAGFFILQYAYRQLTYDRFLENRENIYRVQTNRYNNGELTTQWASGCAGVGLHMKEDFPEVVDFVNLRKSFAQISYEENYFSVSHPYYAGNNFFEVFSIPLVQGVDSLVLKEPMTVVLSESLAKKIFGDESPVGKIIQQNDVANFKVTGVFRDLPERSHFKFDLLYSFDSYVAFAGQEVRTSWQWDGFLNYVVLHPDVDPEELAEKFPEWITSREGEELAQYNAGMEFVLQPLSKIHLISNYRGEIKPTGNQTITYFLLIIGMFVLFIAWINYINLTTARAISRAKEVGIRKVMGSYRAQLIGQFMFESFFLNFVAFAVSAILVVMIFPIFNRFVGNSVVYTWPDTPVFWFGLIGLFLVGFILSGFYPAFVLSNFKPITVLKGKFASSTKGKNLRKGLVTFQFLASVILITGTYVVFKQMTHLRSQDLGVNIDQNVIVKTPVYASDSIMAIKDAVFRNKIAANSAVN